MKIKSVPFILQKKTYRLFGQPNVGLILILLFFFLIIFLNILFNYFQRKGQGRREKHQLVASRTPLTGYLTCNPGMCPWLGIELVTLWFTGLSSILGATPARANHFFLIFKYSCLHFPTTTFLRDLSILFHWSIIYSCTSITLF